MRLDDAASLLHRVMQVIQYDYSAALYSHSFLTVHYDSNNNNNNNNNNIIIIIIIIIIILHFCCCCWKISMPQQPKPRRSSNESSIVSLKLRPPQDNLSGETRNNGPKFSSPITTSPLGLFFYLTAHSLTIHSPPVLPLLIRYTYSQTKEAYIPLMMLEFHFDRYGYCSSRVTGVDPKIHLEMFNYEQ